MDSIRNQILAFAVLATLVPSLVTSIIAYTQNRRAITEKITQELVTAGGQAAREIDGGLKEHLYNLRVFSNSPEVSQRGSGSGRLNDYLSSLQARFSDYDELQVLDAQGHTVASSARNSRPIRLPDDWAKVMTTSGGLVGE